MNFRDVLQKSYFCVNTVLLHAVCSCPPKVDGDVIILNKEFIIDAFNIKAEDIIHSKEKIDFSGAAFEKYFIEVNSFLKSICINEYSKLTQEELKSIKPEVFASNILKKYNLVWSFKVTGAIGSESAKICVSFYTINAFDKDRFKKDKLVLFNNDITEQNLNSELKAHNQEFLVVFSCDSIEALRNSTNQLDMFKFGSIYFPK